MRCGRQWSWVACALTLWACGENASPGADEAGSGGAAGAAGEGGGGASGEGGGGAGGAGGAGATGGASGSGGDSGASGSGATGGDSGAGGADAGSALDSDYYPMVSGASWVYSHLPSLDDPNACAAAGACWDETVSQSDTDWMGEPALLLSGGNPLKVEVNASVLIRVGGEVLRVHREATLNGQPSEEVDYDPGFTRFDEAWVDMPDGTQIDTTYTRVETVVTPGAANLGTQTAVLRTQRFIVEGHESIDVPAGRIDECVKVHRVRRGTTTTGLTVDDKEKRFWFCKGVGKVREDDLTSGGFEVLKSCSMPGGACPP